jgi:hypothetical protein
MWIYELINDSFTDYYNIFYYNKNAKNERLITEDLHQFESELILA